jgi:hypothetical protein
MDFLVNKGMAWTKEKGGVTTMTAGGWEPRLGKKSKGNKNDTSQRYLSFKGTELIFHVIINAGSMSEKRGSESCYDVGQRAERHMQAPITYITGWRLFQQ